MIEKQELTRIIKVFPEQSRDNYVSEEDAIFPELAGMKIFEEPLVGFAKADDELFTKEFKKKASYIRNTWLLKNGCPAQRQSSVFSFTLRNR